MRGLRQLRLRDVAKPEDDTADRLIGKGTEDTMPEPTKRWTQGPSLTMLALPPKTANLFEYKFFNHSYSDLRLT